MISSFDEVVVIYNPNSTGDGKKNAEELRNALEQAKFRAKVTLRETTHAGHAEEMAYEYAKQNSELLLVSSSGDGGYHELINGVIESGVSHITVGLLPSGNANDHYSALADTGDDAVVAAIVSGKTRKIDAIKVTSTVQGKLWVRFAHSYAGLGLSPTIGRQLTKAKLNAVNEKFLLLKYFFAYTHATIRRGGNKERYSSLVFSNINQMSKVIKLAKSGSVDDGKFEVSAVKYRPKLYVLLLLIKSATFGVEEEGSYNIYTFETTKKLLMQLDGEIYKLDAKSEVTVTSAPRVIKTIV